jgi:hypothetical protein
MPRVCSICTHPQRLDLESSVLSGTSIRCTAKAAGVSSFALQRHLKHLAAVVAQRVETAEKQADAAGSLRSRVEEIVADARRIMKAAEEKGQFSAALQGVRSQLLCLELIGQLTGALKNGAAEFVPGTGVSAAAAQASATVTLNMPTPEKKTWTDLDGLLREIYELAPRTEPKKIPPIM